MKSPRDIVKEAIKKANALGWIQIQMKFGEIESIRNLKKDKTTSTQRLTTNQPFMYLADIEKMILNIFEDEEIKNCMMLGELKDG